MGIAMLVFQTIGILTTMLPNSVGFIASWCSWGWHKLRGPAPADRFAAVVYEAMGKVRLAVCGCGLQMIRPPLDCCRRGWCRRPNTTGWLLPMRGQSNLLPVPRLCRLQDPHILARKYADRWLLK